MRPGSLTAFGAYAMGDQFLSSAGTGRNCALSLSLSLSMKVPNPRAVLDKNLGPMGPEFLSNIGAGAWRKVLTDSSSLLDKFLSATLAG